MQPPANCNPSPTTSKATRLPAAGTSFLLMHPTSCCHSSSRSLIPRPPPCRKRRGESAGAYSRGSPGTQLMDERRAEEREDALAQRAVEHRDGVQVARPRHVGGLD